jgi:hypothetical protein
MREVRLAKLDQKGNLIPDDSTPTEEELRRDLANGTRVIAIEHSHMNELHIGGDPNGEIDGDLIRSILAEAAPTNIAAQVALEYWDARGNGARGNDEKHRMQLIDESGVPNWEQAKASFDKAISSVPRRGRRQVKFDTYKTTLVLNLMMGLGSAALGEDFESKARSMMNYACGNLDWDELVADLEGRQCVRGEWKKSHVADNGSQTRH